MSETFSGWMTISSHPASRTAYQETEGPGWTAARVTVDGCEVVSPSIATESVYAQYNGRVQRAIEAFEAQDN